MATALALAQNWRPPVTSPGFSVPVPANYGTAGRESLWHWVRSAVIPQVPDLRRPLSNVLAPGIFHLQVSTVPVTVRKPINVVSQMAFTPAGTATAGAPAEPQNLAAQLWTGLGF